MDPRNELHTLDFKECFELLRTQSVGRLVFTEQALPAIRLVNYSLFNGEIALRIGRSPRIPRLDRAVVAFEVDNIDSTARSGWSVVVIGKARQVVDIDELVMLCDPAHRPWASGGGDQVLCVDTEQVTGQRFPLALG
ncbi:pyridoxamine 5'-phosphate oxidase family protein [Amycolatopsis taiwanensis]|uniref:pyridoxamine 5'-phosphate oxidase family protein n=1 Tax=Amycolatopsis taiwanensis TaxID=342230 RepID=UPI000485ACAE|nr:pyridoxamine 5'-phosphate oxidase family protein [Amycolatopsis taiwanensis]